MLTIKKQILKKQEKAQFIKKNIQESTAIIFYNFSHTENEEVFLLKRKLKQVGADWFVCKNTIFKKALQNENLKIKNNNAFIFCKKDEYKPLKTLKDFDFKKEVANRIQGGIYERKLVDGLTVTKWAHLKPKEDVLNDFCNTLVFEIVRLTFLLNSIKINKEYK